MEIPVDLESLITIIEKGVDQSYYKIQKEQAGFPRRLDKRVKCTLGLLSLVALTSIFRFIYKKEPEHTDPWYGDLGLFHYY